MRLSLAVLFPCLLFSSPVFAATKTPGTFGSNGTVPFISADTATDGTTSTALGFQVNGTEMMRVTAAGRVGIGTTSPSSFFHVHLATDNNISFNTDTSGGTGYARISSHNDALSASAPIYVNGSYVGIQANGSEVMRVTASGAVGIGTTSPNYKFVIAGGNSYVADGNCWSMMPYNGYALATGCGNGIGYFSDARMKKNIVPITTGLDTIMALRPVTFFWKKENNNHALVLDKSKRAMNYGFIAQDVMKVLPDLVGELPAIENPQEAQGVKEKGESRYVLSYEGIIAPTVAAVQELKVSLEKVKTENNALRARLEKLEAREK